MASLTKLIHCCFLLLTVFSVANAQDITTETDQKGYSFFEPSIKLSNINNNLGVLGGAKIGYAFREKYSIGVAYEQLFSQDVILPNNSEGWSDEPYARFNYLAAEFEYIAFQINSTDVSLTSSFGIARASYNHSTVDVQYFDSEYYQRIEAGIFTSKQLLSRLQLRLGASYGFLLNSDDVYYSMPGLGGPNEGSLPFTYKGFSLNFSVRLTMNRY